MSAPVDMSGIDRNARVMACMRPAMQVQYYDPDDYDTYLKQLGIDYEASGRETSGAGH